MARIEKAVFDSGPVIHLSEINKTKCFFLFLKIFITEEVFRELNFKEAPGKEESSKLKNIFKENLQNSYKDFSKIISEKYGLDLGESSSIALCKQKNIDSFLTDDLEARIIGKKYGLNVHGTLGIILRCFREKILSKDETILSIKSLKEASSLFITSNIIRLAVKEVNNFKK